MMSMKEEGKPVSFVEDCAVPLEHLADYTARLTDVFEKHGTRGTWYAHASVGCLHVRPVLNLRLEQGRQGDARHRRGSLRDGARIQGLAFRRARRRHRALGIPRARCSARGWCARSRRSRTASIRTACFNPGKIVRAPKFDDRSTVPLRAGLSRRRRSTTRLDWSAYPGAGGGFQGAVEMCNNNGACRTLAGGVMCPSYRVTRDERDVTRGRANSLRLAITGQLGPDALTSDEMARDAEALRLLQGLPARMPDRRRHGAHEDRGAGRARRQARALAARPAGRLSAALRAVCARSCPGCSTCATTCRGSAVVGEVSPASARGATCRAGAAIRLGASRRASPGADERAREVVLFADTFNRYFERENLEAALARAHRRRLRRASAEARGRQRRVRSAAGAPSSRSAWSTRRGARRERCVAALAPFVARGMPVVGLEPSCLLGFRDELPALVKSDDARALAVAARCCSRNSWRARRRRARSTCRSSRSAKRALLHGHCHQKSFGAMGADRGRAQAHPGARGRDRRVELLRHGRRLRLRRRHHRRVARDGRALAAAGGAQGRAPIR